MLQTSGVTLKVFENLKNDKNTSSHAGIWTQASWVKDRYPTLWEGFWGIVIFGVEIENIGNELEIDSDLQVEY